MLPTHPARLSSEHLSRLQNRDKLQCLSSLSSGNQSSLFIKGGYLNTLEGPWGLQTLYMLV